MQLGRNDNDRRIRSANIANVKLDVPHLFSLYVLSQYVV